MAFVRFRECGASAVVPDIDPALAVTKVSSGGRTFALELPRPTRAAQDQAWHALVSTAGQIGAIVAEIERTAGYRVAVATLADRDGNRLHGSSPQVQAVRQQIDRVARTDFTVLIEGESGVGKELVARQIHEWSRRDRGPFVAVNCAAIVETLLEAELFGIEDRTATGVRGRRGKFEHADGGTLFLDEVADLSLAAQAKLLRALQEFSVERVGGHQTKKVDIRIVAATNRSLSALVDQGPVPRRPLLPPQRARAAGAAAARAARGHPRAGAVLPRAPRGTGPAVPLSAAALEALLTYEWPGNVRELERVIERAIALAEGDEIQLDDLPPALNERYSIVQPAIEGGESMRAWGSRYARLVLERCDNNKRQACRVLDISYHTLQAYLRYTPRLRAPSARCRRRRAIGRRTWRLGRRSPASADRRTAVTARRIGRSGNKSGRLDRVGTHSTVSGLSRLRRACPPWPTPLPPSASAPPLRKTALHAAHVALGARMVPFGGWDMPVEYSGITDEHLAVRTRAGLFDVSHMGEIEIAGRRRAGGRPAASRRNDASRLAVGQAQYSALTTPEGTFVDDLLVYRLAPTTTSCWSSTPANIEKDYAWIRRARRRRRRRRRR